MKGPQAPKPLKVPVEQLFGRFVEVGQVGSSLFGVKPQLLRL